MHQINNPDKVSAILGDEYELGDLEEASWGDWWLWPSPEPAGRARRCLFDPEKNSNLRNQGWNSERRTEISRTLALNSEKFRKINWIIVR